MLSSLGNLPSLGSAGLQLLNNYALGHAVVFLLSRLCLRCDLRGAR